MAHSCTSSSTVSWQREIRPLGGAPVGAGDVVTGKKISGTLIILSSLFFVHFMLRERAGALRSEPLCAFHCENESVHHRRAG